ACWDELRAILQERFASRTRGEWTEIFDGSDACVTPVYDLDEAPDSPLAQERGLFLKPGGITMPAPAPRFGRTPPAEPEGTVDPASATHISLADWGIGPDEISRLAADGIIPPS